MLTDPGFLPLSCLFGLNCHPRIHPFSPIDDLHPWVFIIALCTLMRTCRGHFSCLPLSIVAVLGARAAWHWISFILSPNCFLREHYCTAICVQHKAKTPWPPPTAPCFICQPWFARCKCNWLLTLQRGNKWTKDRGFFSYSFISNAPSVESWCCLIMNISLSLTSAAVSVMFAKPVCNFTSKIQRYNLKSCLSGFKVYFILQLSNRLQLTA